jgi:hypothetical protein
MAKTVNVLLKSRVWENYKHGSVGGIMVANFLSLKVKESTSHEISTRPNVTLAKNSASENSFLTSQRYTAKPKPINVPCAVAIRIELAKTYPRTKFHVKSLRDGKSIHVAWVDGPARSVVENHLKEIYVMGYYDLALNQYIYNNLKKNIFQVKRISCNRMNGRYLENFDQSSPSSPQGLLF